MHVIQIETWPRRVDAIERGKPRPLKVLTGLGKTTIFILQSSFSDASHTRLSTYARAGGQTSNAPLPVFDDGHRQQVRR